MSRCVELAALPLAYLTICVTIQTLKMVQSNLCERSEGSLGNRSGGSRIIRSGGNDFIDRHDFTR
ncbi:hypothetical protein BGZ99_000771, partial [Dissophora globulifera]